MFTVRELETNIPAEQLSEREIYWIDQFDTFNNGYNLTTGGEQGSTIREDVKQSISATMQGLIRSEEQIKKTRETFKKNNIGFSVRGDGTHSKRRVKGTNVNTGEVVIFESLKAACEKLSLKNGNLSRGIKNGYVVGGYKWERIDDKPKSFKIYGKRILDGKIIHHFDSVREAGRVLGTGGASGVTKALKNPSRYSWKGCRWYYQEGEDNQAKT